MRGAGSANHRGECEPMAESDPLIDGNDVKTSKPDI